MIQLQVLKEWKFRLIDNKNESRKELDRIIQQQKEDYQQQICSLNEKYIQSVKENITLKKEYEKITKDV